MNWGENVDRGARSLQNSLDLQIGSLFRPDLHIIYVSLSLQNKSNRKSVTGGPARSLNLDLGISRFSTVTHLPPARKARKKLEK